MNARVATGRVMGWIASQSRVETRWIVARISWARTAARSEISALSSPGRKSSRRDHRARYGFAGTWACMPTSCSIMSAARAPERCSSP